MFMALSCCIEYPCLNPSFWFKFCYITIKDPCLYTQFLVQTLTLRYYHLQYQVYLQAQGHILTSSLLASASAYFQSG